MLNIFVTIVVYYISVQLLCISFFHQSTPELILSCGMDINQFIINSRKKVINNNFYPSTKAPKSKSEYPLIFIRFCRIPFLITWDDLESQKLSIFLPSEFEITGRVNQINQFGFPTKIQFFRPNAKLMEKLASGCDIL